MTTDQVRTGVGEWHRSSVLEKSEEQLPRLHTPAAWPLARDRWERLVTAIRVPDPPDRVWAALVEPAALQRWLAVCHGSLERVGGDCTLDFEDGEFFLCRPLEVQTPTEHRPTHRLQYLWRWLGIGQAALVTWSLEPAAGGTTVTVTEECHNPPADWQTWNGGGWPGILEQLAAYLRTGTSWRWPWRRMGPYVQVELPAAPFEAWDQLLSSSAIKFWLQRMRGDFEPDQVMTIMMGDASGLVDLHVRQVVEAGQSFPSFLPHVDFALRRPAWGSEVGGRLWIEPAGWGRSLFQVFHSNWENLPADLQLPERKIVTAFWAGAMRRAVQLIERSAASGPHGWS